MASYRQPEPAEFVRVWQTSDSVGEAAQRLNMDPRTVKQRAVSYRKAGIALRKFRDNKPLDVAALNDLALAHAPEKKPSLDWISKATRKPPTTSS